VPSANEAEPERTSLQISWPPERREFTNAVPTRPDEPEMTILTGAPREKPCRQDAHTLRVQGKRVKLSAPAMRLPLANTQASEIRSSGALAIE
jgi:hypothetical protein